jgi:hypothetical protein
MQMGKTKHTAFVPRFVMIMVLTFVVTHYLEFVCVRVCETTKVELLFS